MLEDTSTASSEIVAHNLAGASHLVVVTDQAFETDWTTTVYFVCRDADLCTETVSETVCESGGAVPVDAGRVYSLQEDVCGFIVFCYDGVCVFGRMGVDVKDSILDVVNGLDCNVEGEELLSEVIFGRCGELIRIILL